MTNARRLWIGAVVAVATAAAASPAVAAAPAPRGCPSAKTCRLYRLESYRWPVSGGRATVTFVVNPIQPWVPPADAAAAAVAAAGAWSAAHPAIRVDYRGTTTALPVLGDGINQIGWAEPGGLNTLAKANVFRRNGRVVEADIVLSTAFPWGYTPCANRDRSCGDVAPDAGLLRRFDIQAVLTHEIGHWLGIGHLDSPHAAEQTMYVEPRAGERKAATLALGDVLAVRAAYPCRSCRMPRIVAP